MKAKYTRIFLSSPALLSIRGIADVSWMRKWQENWMRIRPNFWYRRSCSHINVWVWMFWMSMELTSFVLWIVYNLIRIQLWTRFGRHLNPYFHVIMMLRSWASVWCRRKNTQKYYAKNTARSHLYTYSKRKWPPCVHRKLKAVSRFLIN